MNERSSNVCSSTPIRRSKARERMKANIFKKEEHRREPQLKIIGNNQGGAQDKNGPQNLSNALNKPIASSTLSSRNHCQMTSPTE
jgi:hypothetical protein